MALLMVLVPLAAAQEDPGAALDPDRGRATSMITFYPHIFALTSDFPMPGNTQFPSGENDFSAGYPDWGCYPEPGKPVYDATPTIPAVPVLADSERLGTCQDWDNNLLYVYSTAGLVDVKNEDTWDYVEFHNERGQAKDILLDTTQDITTTFYMSADWHGWALCGFNPAPGLPWPFPCWNWDPGFYPNWRVEAKLLLGSMGEYQGQASDPPPVHQKVLSGDVVTVGEGISAPQNMLSLDATLNGGQGEVYEFTINLGKPQVDKIPREMDWIMVYRWYIEAQSGTTMLANVNWNVNSGEFYPNRFVLPVKNPFDVELVFPQFLHDKLLIHAMLNSPWGSYDVDAKSVRIEITEDGGRPVEMQRFSRVADFSVAHGGHYKPVNITWVWDYRGDQLRPGVYKVAVTATNYQHSAASTTEASFRVNPDGTGSVLSVGRSGQQTFTEEQLRAVERGAAGNVSSFAASLDPVEPARVPGPGALAVLALLAIVPLTLRRKA